MDIRPPQYRLYIETQPIVFYTKLPAFTAIKISLDNQLLDSTRSPQVGFLA